jgi:hypothetical protein
MRTLETTKDVIGALGGVPQVRELTQAKSDSVVWNWSVSDRFPAKTYFVMSAALRQRGVEAPPTLWGMTVPAASEAAA